METSLRSEAEQLDDAAINWARPSVPPATARRAGPRTRPRQGCVRYRLGNRGHARYVQGLAEQAKAHVRNFSKVLTTSLPMVT